jgi:hypothetical protein
MRLPPEEHLAHDWRVTALAADFELLDVWRYPIEIEASIPLASFIEFMKFQQAALVESSGAAGMLFRLRGVLGKLFRWDDDDEGAPSEARPIPGCTETTVCARLEADERSAVPGEPQSGGFSPVYLFENESLLEISNATVHALMHLGRVAISESHWSPQMAVYVKTRGALGRGYMRLIGPFRHLIVYPAMMRAAARGWPTWLARSG